MPSHPRARSRHTLGSEAGRHAAKWATSDMSSGMIAEATQWPKVGPEHELRAACAVDAHNTARKSCLDRQEG
jgi:hypothetical protein